VSPEEHRAIAEDFCDFMGGDTTRFVKRLEREMATASKALEFEQAARLRDDLVALGKALEKSAIVLGDGTDADVFALAEDGLEVAVQVFHVRGGRVRGQRGWVAEMDAESVPEVVGHLLQQVYGGESGEGVPREVLVPVLPDEPRAVSQWLGTLRGSNVDLRVPQRGDKRTLLDTVRRNAEQSLTRHKLARAGDLTARSQALQELQETLDLEDAPLRIECFDISHIQGSQVVGSMVVFEDGLVRKSEYRRFVIRGEQVDDTAAMDEVLTRRFQRYLEERDDASDVELGPDPENAGPERIDPDTGRPKKFAYPPNLVVVDGGLPQVNAAKAALDRLGIDDVALVGLAKRLEEVWLPGEAYPVILQRSSEGLYLLQRLRDEAHRFAITAHRKRRSKGMTTSVLDDVPGLGPARQAALLRHFGSVKRLRAASVEEIASVQGMGERTAAAVVAALAAPGVATDPVPESAGMLEA
jgi:excinuclease ABC subunit C